MEFHFLHPSILNKEHLFSPVMPTLCYRSSRVVNCGFVKNLQGFFFLNTGRKPFFGFAFTLQVMVLLIPEPWLSECAWFSLSPATCSSLVKKVSHRPGFERLWPLLVFIISKLSEIVMSDFFVVCYFSFACFSATPHQVCHLGAQTLRDFRVWGQCFLSSCLIVSPESYWDITWLLVICSFNR